MEPTTFLLSFIAIVQIIHGLGTWKLYTKAGRKAWEAFVPVYNGVILMKIINRPTWWVILLFIPVINILMFMIVWVETVRSFGKKSTVDSILVIISLGFYIYYLNYVEDVSYDKERSLDPPSTAGEWVGSIAYAIIVATLVHNYFIQPFVIPTSSLEKTLLVGDFLFVSKFHYGARTPMTPVAAPMVHDTIPFIKNKSYLSEPQIPWFRFPGFQKIKRNDIVVFNWPADTVNAFRPYTDNKHYHKPVDKKSNYVKRCVGLPGDKFAIKDGYVYIDGKQNELPDRAKVQFFHMVETKLRPEPFYKKFGKRDIKGFFYATDTASWNNKETTNFIKEINERGIGRFSALYTKGAKTYFSGYIGGQNAREIRNQLQSRLKYSESNPVGMLVNLDKETATWIKQDSKTGLVKRITEDRGSFEAQIFPHDPQYNWNNDNYGEIIIPKAGSTITLSPKNFKLYQRLIEEYEGNQLSVDDGTYYINGQQTNTYTVKQDYYWMMGDNRQMSEDSRFWGFVPQDHIIGKPVFIWMSWDSYLGKPRWDRIFTTVHGQGKSVNYFKYFAIFMLGYIGFSQYRKRKKEKENA